MNICGVNLSFDFAGFQGLYVIITCLMWVCALLFSKEYMTQYESKKRYYIFMIATWIATVGVLASGNLLTTFIFFEIMSFTSYVLVIQKETPNAMRAGETYLAVAVIGGMVMLMGLMLLYNALGTLEIAELSAEAAVCTEKGKLFAAGICILFGFGAKAGIVPLHIWLPKAYPVAPAPATALLSSILTKSGIFGMVVISATVFMEDKTWGTMMAIIGIVTMFLGAVLGIFSTDLKRTVACSSASQIGFITIGIGMLCLLGEENSLAASGTVLHMINHSFIKILLFLAAGAIYMKINKLDLTEITGYGRKKPLLAALFAVGALSISGVPGFSGYISKTLLHESIVEYIEVCKASGAASEAGLFGVMEWIFLITGGLTFCYMLKLFICVFIKKNKNAELQAEYDSMKSYMSPLSAICLIVPAVILLVLGVTPHITMEPIAGICMDFMRGAEAEHAVAFFSWTNLKGACISLAIGVAVYFLIVRNFFIKDGEYKNLWPEKLDLEELVYRPFIKLMLKPGIFGIIDKIPDAVVGFTLGKLLKQFGPDTPHGIVEKVQARKAGKGAEKTKPGLVASLDSLSYGLLAAVAGLIAVLIYMMIRFMA